MYLQYTMSQLLAYFPIYEKYNKYPWIHLEDYNVDIFYNFHLDKALQSLKTYFVLYVLNNIRLYYIQTHNLHVFHNQGFCILSYL